MVIPLKKIEASDIDGFGKPAVGTTQVPLAEMPMSQQTVKASMSNPSLMPQTVQTMTPFLGRSDEGAVVKSEGAKISRLQALSKPSGASLTRLGTAAVGRILKALDPANIGTRIDRITSNSWNNLLNFSERLGNFGEQLGAEQVMSRAVQVAAAAEYDNSNFGRRKRLDNRWLLQMRNSNEEKESASFVPSSPRIPIAATTPFAPSLKHVPTTSAQRRLSDGERVYSPEATFQTLDDKTINDLDLLTPDSGLYHLLRDNSAATIFGDRRLQWVLTHPLQDVTEIHRRQEAVAELTGNASLRKAIDDSFQGDAPLLVESR